MKPYLILILAVFTLYFAPQTYASQACKALLQKLSEYPINENIKTDVRKRLSINDEESKDISTIFYPFGGIDILTPVQISSNVRKVIAVGLHPFGDLFKSLEHIETVSRDTLDFVDASEESAQKQVIRFEDFLSLLEPRVRNLYDLQFEIVKKRTSKDRHQFMAAVFEEFLNTQAHGMLSSPTVDRASQFGRGLALMGLFQIQYVLGGTIQNVEYLSYENGHWGTSDLAHPPSAFPEHGKITFTYQGRTIEYYLIRANLMDPEVRSNEQLLSNWYDIYLAEAVRAANRNDVGIAEVAKFLGSDRRISILKFIHQACGKLQTRFKQLNELFEESAYLFMEGDSAKPGDFPNHKLLRNDGNSTSIFRR